MAKIKYLTVDEVLELHDVLIKRYGGAGGIRDEGLLSSALYRPQSGYYRTIFEQAASLMQSLALNHVFVDGNKRAAFSACDIFLRMNRVELNIVIEEAEQFLVERVIQKKAELNEIAQWLKQNSSEV